MAKHKIELTLPKHDIINTDVDFWVWEDDVQIGHLHISKGGVDWYQGKSFVSKRSMSWAKFTALIEKNVPLSVAKVPKKKKQ